MSDSCKLTVVPPKVAKILASCSSLPSLPSVVLKIIDASKDPDIGLAEVAEIIRVDAALSAKLLKIANSPLYSQRRKITNLKDSLSVLGLNAALTIALSFSLVKSLASSADAKYNYDSFWKRSILSASIARQLALRLAQPNLEDFFLAGLLQDIGILVLDCSNLDCPANACDSSHLSRIQCERNSLGIDHSDVGAWLLKSWNLPEKLYKAALCSHTLYTNPEKIQKEEIFYRCIGLSGSLADIWFGKDREELLAQNLASAENLLHFNIENLNDFISEINETLPEFSLLFDMTIIEDQRREEILNEARNILMERQLNFLMQYDACKVQIESLTEKTRDIEDEANRDHLTGVYNRKYVERLLIEEFNKSSAERQPLSLAFIDIDDFKPINDTYGHLSGDRIIQDIASFFAANIRQTDTLARYGGDEFLLILPNTDADISTHLLNRLIADLQQLPATEIKGQ